MGQMDESERVKERLFLLKRIFPTPYAGYEDSLVLFKIGKELNDSYCRQFNDRGYTPDYKSFDSNTVIQQVSEKLSDDLLLRYAKVYRNKLSESHYFLGRYYTYDPRTKELILGSKWSELRKELEKFYGKHGKTLGAVLKACYEISIEEDKKWKNWFFIQNRLKELGAGKGWRSALTDLERVRIIKKHKGDIEIPEELAPFVKGVLKEWEERPWPKPERIIKIDKHKVLQDFVAAYPERVFGEKVVLVASKFRINQDEIDQIFEDLRKNRIIVDIKPAWEEKAIGQLLRYKTEYSEKENWPKEKIRLAIVCGEKIAEKFLTSIKESGIELYSIEISISKI